MAKPLPVFTVASLADAERVPIHDGPHRVLLLRAGSLSDARGMLSVLWAKGVLQAPHADAEGFDEFAIHAADAEEHEGVDSEGSGSGSDIPWTGWVVEEEDDSVLRLVGSDAGSDHAAAANGAELDEVADGWAVDNLPRFRRAIEITLLVEDVISYIHPLLVADAADADALDRLRTQALEIRRVGKEVPGLMGQAPVTCGNYLTNVVRGAVRWGSTWMEARRDVVLACALHLYEEVSVDLQDANA